MCEQVEIGGFLAKKQEDGTFIYKSKSFEIPKKKVKSQYKDKPQFPVVEQVEQKFKDRGKEMIFNIGKEVVKYLDKNL